MALINFSRKDFVNAVADGSKHFTIRQLRKKSIKKEETLQLYTGIYRLTNQAGEKIKGSCLYKCWGY